MHTLLKNILLMFFIIIPSQNILGETFILPANLEVIGEEAFAYDTSLDEVILPDGFKIIEKRAFAYSSIQTIYLPATVTAIADDAFEGLKNVSICAPYNTFAYNWALENDYISRDKDKELQEANNLGFLTSERITYHELYKLFDKLVQLVDPESFFLWEDYTSDVRNIEKTVSRENAMVAIFNLADFLGQQYFCINSWDTIIWENDWDEWNPESYWGDLLRNPVRFNGEKEQDINYSMQAYYYSTGRISLKSGNTIFDYDMSSNSLRCNDNITSFDMACAILRLYESCEQKDKDYSYYSESIDHNSFISLLSSTKTVEIDDRILTAYENRKRSIRNSISNIGVSGKTYYVSSSGNDSNSGMSPNEPWKSLYRVNSHILQPGDAVLFERGNTWRGECLCLKEGVTYSAYGDGEKPAIYGSPENGTGAEKWNLLKGTNNIWVYYKEILECGTIVFNDELGALKINAYVQNGSYKMPDGSGRNFDVSQALAKNLSFYSDDDYFLKHENVWEGLKSPGKLYLRCDEGNPGSLFNDIEFCIWPNTDSGAKGILYQEDKNYAIRNPIIVDNLTVKYTGGYGINLGGASATIQNCEIGWIGGGTTNQEGDYFVNAGNCIGNYGEIDNYRIIDCYLYQAYDSGISNESANIQKNIEYRGNLIEKCLFGIEMLSGIEAYSSLDNVDIIDNMIIYSGYGFGSVRQERRWNKYDAAIMTHPYYQEVSNVKILNNILCKSQGYLVLWGSKDKPYAEGNTYIQDTNGGLCLWRFADRLIEFAFDDYAASIIKNVIKDYIAVIF